jgi:hypothetical protein
MYEIAPRDATWYQALGFAVLIAHPCHDELSIGGSAIS